MANANNEEKMVLNPSTIRFTQNTISERFGGNYGKVHDLIDDLANLDETKRQEKVQSIDKIEVIKDEKKYYSLNNRRLYVYRVLECDGKLNKIEVKKSRTTMKDLKRKRKFTAQKDHGESIKFSNNNAKTKRHDFKKQDMPEENPAKTSESQSFSDESSIESIHNSTPEEESSEEPINISNQSKKKQKRRKEKKTKMRQKHKMILRSQSQSF